MDVSGAMVVVQDDDREDNRRGDHEHNAVEISACNVSKLNGRSVAQGGNSATTLHTTELTKSKGTTTKR